MTPRACCIWLEDQGGLLLRDPAELPEAVRDALEHCEACQAALAGAERLRAELEVWRDEEPADDLVERSLAAIALKAARETQPEEAPLLTADDSSSKDVSLPEPVADQPAGRRRTTVIEFVTAPVGDPAPIAAPSSSRLWFRFGLQAAAAALLFVASSVFVAVYYPAVASALEERDVSACQERLSRLRAAAKLYRVEHPDGPPLVGFELRRELIRAGYVDESDFVCPSKRGKELGQRSYVGELPAGIASLNSGRPLFWDRFGNHSTGFNLIRADGRTHLVSEEGLTRFRFRAEEDHQEPK